MTLSFGLSLINKYMNKQINQKSLKNSMV